MASSKSTHTDNPDAPPPATAANARPAFQDVPEAVAGPGQVVVESPTGIRTAVPEDAVDGLKPQGYRVV